MLSLHHLHLAMIQLCKGIHSYKSSKQYIQPQCLNTDPAMCSKIIVLRSRLYNENNWVTNMRFFVLDYLRIWHMTFCSVEQFIIQVWQDYRVAILVLLLPEAVQIAFQNFLWALHTHLVSLGISS